MIKILYGGQQPAEMVIYVKFFPAELVFVNGVQESIPPGWESVPGSLKGLQIRAQEDWSSRQNKFP
jgi:hypothetical protein